MTSASCAWRSARRATRCASSGGTPGPRDEPAGTTSAEDDTHRPTWAGRIELDLSRHHARLGFYDEDLVFDDDVQEVWFTLDDARYLAGRGEYEATHLGYPFSLVVEVEAVW